MMLIALFMIILLTFVIEHSIPGGPFTTDRKVSPEVEAALNEKYHLNDPLPKQFLDYLGGILHGDFGPSYKYTGKEENKKYDGKFRMGFLSVMPHVKASWFDNPHFGMYSKVAVGAAGVFQKDGESSITWAAQLSPVCMDFGGSDLRGYLELGVGMQGIVTLGIKKMF